MDVHILGWAHIHLPCLQAIDAFLQETGGEEGILTKRAAMRAGKREAESMPWTTQEAKPWEAASEGEVWMGLESPETRANESTSSCRKLCSILNTSATVGEEAPREEEEDVQDRERRKGRRAGDAQLHLRAAIALQHFPEMQRTGSLRCRGRDSNLGHKTFVSF